MDWSNLKQNSGLLTGSTYRRLSRFISVYYTGAKHRMPDSRLQIPVSGAPDISQRAIGKTGCGNTAIVADCTLNRPTEYLTSERAADTKVKK